MKKITLFIMDVGVLDQRFSLSEYWQGKSLVSRVGLPPVQADNTKIHFKYNTKYSESDR